MHGFARSEKVVFGLVFFSCVRLGNMVQKGQKEGERGCNINQEVWQKKENVDERRLVTKQKQEIV